VWRRCLEKDSRVRNPVEELEKRRAHQRTFSTAALSGGGENGDGVTIRWSLAPARWSVSDAVHGRSSWQQQPARMAERTDTDGRFVGKKKVFPISL
jgi:hypothetical protein